MEVVLANMKDQNFNPRMVGKRFKRLRKSKQLSIEGLAKEASVNKNTIVRLEKGEKKPSLETVLKVCRALDISIAELIDGKPVENIDYIKKYLKARDSKEWLDGEVKPGYREDRKTIKKGTSKIIDPNLHLNGGFIHAGILEITGEGELHTHNAREELLFCLTGKIMLNVSGKEIILKKGDGVIFWGTEPHSYSYIESQKDRAVCLSVLVNPEAEKLEDFNPKQ
jgi:transcriptional regulator with XRE-family HTH domain